MQQAQTPSVPQGNAYSLAARPLFLCLLPLFAASGCCALIYEIVWFQMLQLVIGSTAVSLAVLLASFMGGMFLGSILFARLIAPGNCPLRVWAFLEAGLGALGMAVWFMVPCLTSLYTTLAPPGFAGLATRGIISALCLLAPTMLMGATLPAIARLAGQRSEGAWQVGLAYGVNTIGGVIGALLAGFVLLRIANVFAATCGAAALNESIALIALMVPARLAQRMTVEQCAGVDQLSGRRKCDVYLAISLSGFCALAAEVIWTRILSLIFGATTYTFSIILAAFLLGLGIGGAAGAFVARRARSPGSALGYCQLLLVAAIAWAAWMLVKSLPYWPINPALSKSIWYDFQLDFLRCLWAILPATCLWGASFPLALAAVAEDGGDSALLVGKVYAANTMGAIFGAVAGSLLLIVWLGTQQTQQLLVLISSVAACLPLLRRFGSMTARKRLLLGSLAPIAAILIVVLLATSIPPVPWPLVAYGRYLPTKTELGRLLYGAEGMNASIAVTELETGVRNFHISGKIEASSDLQDMRLQRMLGHIPALFHPDPHSVLVVGCGAGVTAGSFLVHPGVKKISLCEIERLIPTRVARYFAQENYDLVEDPRVRLIYDDARHYLLTTRERFDVITSDPIHPWVKGAAALYTKEYFELCKRHLNPGGMVSQWVPLYESSVATVKSEIATFFEVFPDATIWSNENMGEGYDLVLLGQVGPLEVDVETLQRRLNRSDHKSVVQSLRDVGIRSAFGLAATYAGQARDLQPWLRNAEINRDRDLRLQYLAGMGLNYHGYDLIYNELSSYRRFPEEIFLGSNSWNDALRRTLEQPSKRLKR